MNTMKSVFGILTITAALAMQIHAQNWLTNGLVAYYPFNGNANDVSGNGHNGTVNGAALTADRFGSANSAYYFNGLSSEILVPETLFGPTNQFWTLSLWVTCDSGFYSPWGDVYRKSSLNGEVTINVLAGRVMFGIKTASQATFSVTAPVRTNSAMHVVGVYRKGQSISLYIDGVLQGSVPVSNEDLWVSGFPLTSSLGSYHYTPGPYAWFGGTIDDFRVYTRALSASEVQQLYAYESVPSCVSPPAGLVAWWPGQGNANDIVVTNNGTLSGGTSFTSGKVGQAFSFNGSNGTVIVPDSSSLRLTAEFTIEAWINTRSTNADQAIVGKVGIANGNNGYELFLSAENWLCGQFNSPGQGWPGNVIVYPNGTAIVPNVWHHVAWTYDQSAMKLYLNGSPVATNVIGPQTVAVSSTDLRISGLDNHVYFDGLIDEPAVYNRALSASEIAAIHAAGSSGKCLRPLTDGLVAYYPFNGNANDESGHGMDGVVYGATLTADRFGITNSAYSFNGTSAYIKTVNTLPDMQSASASCWIRVPAFSGHDWYVFMDGDDAPGRDFFVNVVDNTRMALVVKDNTYCWPSSPPLPIHGAMLWLWPTTTTQTS